MSDTPPQSPPPRIEALTISTFKWDEVFRQLDRIQDRNKQPYIPVIICSGGGDTVALTALTDALAATGKPIWTVNVGMAYSCAASLLAAGTQGHRYVFPNAQTMVHGTAAFNPAPASQTSLNSLRAMALNEQIADGHMFGLLDRWTAKPPGHWQNCVQRANGQTLYYVGQEAVAAGLADHACVPPEMFTWKGLF